MSEIAGLAFLWVPEPYCFISTDIFQACQREEIEQNGSKIFWLEILEVFFKEANFSVH